jgi:predicted nucleic-acid-binding protein
MDVVFVDANVFLRHLTKDNDDQASRAKGLFLKAQAGRLRLVTGPPVLFEIAWTLKIRYKLKQTEILDILESLVTSPWLDMPDKELVGDAIILARNFEQDFADAYIHVSALKMGAKGVATFNKKHFDRLGTKLISF